MMCKLQKWDDINPVLVKWQDSTSIDGWTTLDNMKNTEVDCQSVGILVDETAETVTLALTYAPTGSRDLYGQAIVIPRRAISIIYPLEAIDDDELEIS